MVNNKILELESFHGIAEQGRSRPFTFVAEDQCLYYVKQDMESRAREWIAGNLALLWNLPIAPFSLVYLSEDLLDEIDSCYKGAAGLREGLFFGSKEIKRSRWPESIDFKKRVTDTQFKQSLLMFDFWIQNSDRTKENVNLIFGEEEQSIFVIDHNLAFDEEFSPKCFFEEHLFHSEWITIKNDLFLLPSFQEKMKNAFCSFDTIVQKIPDEWFWFNEEKDIPILLNIETVKENLEKKFSEEFWREM